MGASNIKAVKLEKTEGKLSVKEKLVKAHEGDVRETLREVLGSEKFNQADKFAVTGRKFKELVDLPTLAEPKATEIAYSQTNNGSNDLEAIVSAGGETFMVYELNDEGNIIDVYTGNKCASGTGEFYFQQLKRMGVEPEETEEIAQLDDPYEVSGRCSVFCKSDCTHALNKGEDKGRIVAGLSEMMVKRISEQLSKCSASRVMLVGGTARNKVMLEELGSRVDELQVPDEAVYFEALGAAVWALENGGELEKSELFVENRSSFDFMKPLAEYRDKVEFHEIERSQPKPGDRCLLGIDVGSTTTKAVLIRESDNNLLASIYLRTEGDPVTAARECYSRIDDQLGEVEIKIIGLGVTGSGRNIVGLHALTDSVINEIIAHAQASVYFDEEVDTIFEIGGQDAKYTYLVNGVPTDYAMNEACAAGTGSFLEESAFETLNVEMEEIADYALEGRRPPNFSDQCSAFISSDIKTAIQEGISVEDICAGLVYSVCRNYTNRVKESRPVGKKVFMQGGVCYNRAVPMAMAALTGKDIIVPPEPGLMGAYGVALVVKENISLGLTEEEEFDLAELAERQVQYHEPFVCCGGAEDCDRKCEINLLEISGKKYPFGGICNKYYNHGEDEDFDVRELDLVRRREELVFDDYFSQPREAAGGYKIGINRSLSVNTLLPMFSRFFAELGHEVVLPEEPTEEGKQRPAAAFCYPVEISHGFIDDLLKNHETDYIFLPQVKGMPVADDQDRASLCPLSQGEPYYLKSIWSELEGDHVFNPVLDLQEGFEAAEEEFMQVGQELGHGKAEIKEAFRAAVQSQEEFRRTCREIGRETLKKLEQRSDERAIVIFGRAYNALTSVANMGIPHKFASRGELVMPFDMLPLEEKETDEQMYWALGQQIMRGARLVSEHPQLFGTFITNFSCGPDSFLISYFRRISGRKPTLTLELDSHTADAGIDTRVEAFLDVIASYRKLDEEAVKQGRSSFQPARIEQQNGELEVIDSSGKSYPLDDDRVELLIPSMGRTITRAFAAALRYCGFSARVCDPPGKAELKSGKANCTGKECLPLQLTLGSLVNHIEADHEPGKILVYFMPSSGGPCRFGQYNVFMRNFIKDNEIKDVALLSLSDEDNYAGLGTKFTVRAWQAVVTGDVLSDIYSSLRALAVDKKGAMEEFEEMREEIFETLASGSWFAVRRKLKQIAERLSRIELKQSPTEAPRVGLVGEIYVRSDEFSRRYLVRRLADRGIVTRVSPAHEWLYYIDYLLQEGIDPISPSWITRMKNKLTLAVKKYFENDIKSILAGTGLTENHPVDVSEIVEATGDKFSDQLTGEAVLSIGAAIEEIVDRVDGVVALGPFGCMPHRLSESVLSESLAEQKLETVPEDHPAQEVYDELSLMPFLAIETDGNVFSQEVESRLEAFCLQVKRLCRYRQNGDGVEPLSYADDLDYSLSCD